MKPWISRALVTAGVAAVVLVTITAPWVWIWDLVSPEVHVLADVKLPSNAGEVRLEQYWNNIDFYSVELLHFHTNGSKSVLVVDGDATKQWFCRASIEEASSVIRFENSFGVVARYDWERGILLRERQ